MNKKNEPSVAGTVSVGTVRWFDNSTGYGFIVPDHGGSGVLVQAPDVAAPLYLKQGTKVSYRATKQSIDQLAAKDIVVIGGFSQSDYPRPQRSFGLDPDLYGVPLVSEAGSGVPQILERLTELTQKIKELAEEGRRTREHVDGCIAALADQLQRESLSTPKEATGLVAPSQAADRRPYVGEITDGSGQESAIGELVDEASTVPEAGRAIAAQRALLECGAWVRSNREKRNWTLEEMAKRVGTTPSQLSLIERGIGKRGPSLDLVARVLWSLDQRIHFPGASK